MPRQRIVYLVFESQQAKSRLVCRYLHIKKQTIFTNISLLKFKTIIIPVSQGFHNKYHRLGVLNNINQFSHISGGWKSKSKVLAGLGSPEASLLGLQASFLFLLLCLHPHMAFPLCLHILGLSSSSSRDTSPIGLKFCPDESI